VARGESTCAHRSNDAAGNAGWLGGDRCEFGPCSCWYGCLRLGKHGCDSGNEQRQPEGGSLRAGAAVSERALAYWAV
ncbi:MAG TPA: hypothetical protein VIW94_12230, partial [Acidimicrobiia bacterium]